MRVNRHTCQRQTNLSPSQAPLKLPLKPPGEGLEAPLQPAPSSPPSSLLKVKGTVRFSLRILPATASSGSSVPRRTFIASDQSVPGGT